MEKEQYRAVIRFLFLEGKTFTEIKQRLDAVYKDHAPLMATVIYWTNEFKRGRTSVFDEERPKELTDVEMFNKIRDIVLEDGQLKVNDIAKKVKISYERAENILHEHLGMRKLSDRWVPRVLTVDHKRDRVTTSKHCLELFQRNPTEFMRRYVTVDRTWIYYGLPEMREQSYGWSPASESAPEANTSASGGKVLATVFWGSQGIIHIDYLEKGKTITGAYYAALLNRFHTQLMTKRPDLSRQEVLFHRDDASASGAVAAKLYDLRYELLPHPAASPDLTPFDFYLFPNVETWLGGRKFTTRDEIIPETNAYFEDFPKTYFWAGIKQLEYRWAKCIELEGDYVEE